MLPKIEIQDIFRVSNVRRWGIVETTKEQDVAQHSFNVAHITREFVNRLMDGGFFAEWDKKNKGSAFYMSVKMWAVELALMHDLSEIFTGDIPTPFKVSLTRNPHGWESETIVQFQESIPKDIRFEVLMIVRVADILEAIRFISWYCENRIHKEHILKGLSERFTESTTGTVDEKFESVAKGLLEDITTDTYENYL